MADNTQSPVTSNIYGDLYETPFENLTSRPPPRPAAASCCVPGSERIVVPVIFSIIVLLGCFGNGLVITVVFKNKSFFRNTTNIFIVNLAVADLMFLIFCVPFHAVIHTSPEWPFGECMCKVVHLVQYASMAASILTLVAMALDRYLAVVYPLKTKHLRTPKTALMVILFIWILSIVIALPWPVFYTVKVYRNIAPRPIAICADNWGAYRKQRSLYFLLLFLVTYAIPLVAITVLSILMVRQLWILPEPDCPRLGSSLKAKRKVTFLVIFVIAVFFICWLPSHVIWVWTNFFRKTWRRNYTFYYMRILAHVFSYANSSMNPVIYAFLSKNFRRGFRRALRCDTARLTATGSPVGSQSKSGTSVSGQSSKGNIKMMAPTCGAQMKPVMAMPCPT